MPSETIDILWVMISIILVALMQPGFTALEAGSTRAKNSTSTAIKNVSDFILSVFIFLVFGAGLMLGSSYGGLFGIAPWFYYTESLEQISLVLFHAMFAATAVTIISGSIAERTNFSGYLFIAIWISFLIYPLEAHWIWNENGWLAQLGFVDFAGSTVVHSVGGWAALAAIMIIGPRLGRFENDTPFEKSNLAYSALGVLLIWIGWIGFNGGSLLSLNHQTGVVILNTILAGATGGISGLLVSRLKSGYYQVEDIMNGILSGLVCVTALANLIEPAYAILAGIIGYLSYLLGKQLMLTFKLDDAIDAVPVHLVAGISGTLLTAFFVPDSIWHQQLLIQLIGILSVGAFTFTLTYLFLYLLNRYIFTLRVSESNEVIGLNISEHQARTSIHDLIHLMRKHADSQDFSTKVAVEPFSDAFIISEFYNDVTKSFNRLNEENYRLIEEASYLANYDHLTGLAKRRLLFAELERITARQLHSNEMHALIFLDLDGFKLANDTYGHDTGDEILKEVTKRLKATIHQSDLASRFGGDEFVVLLSNIQNQSAATNIAEKIISSVKKPMHSPNGEEIFINCSIGIKCFDHTNQLNIDDLIKAADSAMYIAKKNGKGRWIKSS